MKESTRVEANPFIGDGMARLLWAKFAALKDGNV